MHGLRAAPPIYEVGGQRFENLSFGFSDAIAEAHSTHLRPRCMCQTGGLDMYVARLGDGFMVKRMPHTGGHHASECPSYEPVEELSGLGQMQNTAIAEDLATGLVTLRLGFPLSRSVSRSTQPSESRGSDSTAAAGAKLSMHGLGGFKVEARHL